MAHIHTPKDIPVRYLGRSSSANLVFGGIFLVGLAGFLWGLSVDPDRAWQSYVSNWLFFTGVAMGAVMFTAATQIVKAKWNWSVKRISLSFSAFLPLAFVLLIPMVMFLRESYFPWIEMMEYDYIVQKKEAYLNVPFLVARQLGGALLLFGMGLYFAFLMLRPDQGLTHDIGDDDARRASWRTRLMSNWQGQEAEEARSWNGIKRLAPALALTYAAVMSFFVYDWAMTLEPHWFSTLFGGWYFMGAFLCGVTATSLLAVVLRAQDTAVEKAVAGQQLHDLGKLSFAFTAFWAYLFFSQYIVIWYGKLPWEQAWIIHRSGPIWGPLALVTIVLVFIVPFAGLMGRSPKRTPAVLGIFASISLIGIWLERYMLVAPSLNLEGPAFVVWQPLTGLMFLGLFCLSVRWFLTTFPMIQLWTPAPEPEMIEAELVVGAD
jgi:hypothetical protein